MTGAAAQRLDLPQGLSAQQTAALSALVAEATGDASASGAMPWLAPALLFSDSAVQARLALPVAGPTDALVHEYQAIRYHRDFPCGVPATATATSEPRGASVTYRFDISTHDGTRAASLETALRLMPIGDVGSAKPAQIRSEALGQATWGAAITLTQDQVATYVAASGDRNPIHSDAKTARAMGLTAPVVPGLMLVSLIQPLCTRAAPDARLQELKARFLAPLCVGQTFRICAQQRGVDARTGAIRLRAYILAKSDCAVAISDLAMTQNSA